MGCQKPAPPPSTTPTVDTKGVVAADPDSQVEADGDSARVVLETIFAEVLLDECDSIAPLVAYRGIGGEGDYKRACDYSLPDERVTVDKICAQIKVLLHDLTQTTFDEFSIEEEAEGYWHVWKVRFDHSDGSQSTSTFGLIEATGKLLLGDID